MSELAWRIKIKALLFLLISVIVVEILIYYLVSYLGYHYTDYEFFVIYATIAFLVLLLVYLILFGIPYGSRGFEYYLRGLFELIPPPIRIFLVLFTSIIMWSFVFSQVYGYMVRGVLEVPLFLLLLTIIFGIIALYAFIDELKGLRG